MKMPLPSNFHLLREQVYQHLRKELKNQHIKPGSFVTINQLSKQLGINRTPLRDALLQLQAEGFVTFLPQRGIQINELTRKDLEDIYEILGALDSRALFTVFDRITAEHIQKMRQINEQMYACESQEEYNRYFDLNTAFHNVYLELSTNKMLLSQVNIYRQRLFDFGAKGKWLEKVRKLNYAEHLKFIELIEKADAKVVSDFIRDVHCCINWE